MHVVKPYKQRLFVSGDKSAVCGDLEKFISGAVPPRQKQNFKGWKFSNAFVTLSYGGDVAFVSIC